MLFNPNISRMLLHCYWYYKPQEDKCRMCAWSLSLCVSADGADQSQLQQSCLLHTPLQFIQLSVEYIVFAYKKLLGTSKNLLLPLIAPLQHLQLPALLVQPSLNFATFFFWNYHFNTEALRIVGATLTTPRMIFHSGVKNVSLVSVAQSNAGFQRRRFS